MNVKRDWKDSASQMRWHRHAKFPAHQLLNNCVSFTPYFPPSFGISQNWYPRECQVRGRVDGSSSPTSSHQQPPGLPQPFSWCWFLWLDVRHPALSQEAEACRMTEESIQKSCPQITSLYQGQLSQPHPSRSYLPQIQPDSPCPWANSPVSQVYSIACLGCLPSLLLQTLLPGSPGPLHAPVYDLPGLWQPHPRRTRALCPPETAAVSTHRVGPGN